MNPGAFGFSAGTPAGIKSIQRGLITFPSSAAGSTTATISPVNTAKTELRFLGLSTDAIAGNVADGCVRIALTNATTITATKQGGSYTPAVSWELTEWY